MIKNTETTPPSAHYPTITLFFTIRKHKNLKSQCFYLHVSYVKKTAKNTIDI